MASSDSVVVSVGNLVMARVMEYFEALSHDSWRDFDLDVQFPLRACVYQADPQLASDIPTAMPFVSHSSGVHFFSGHQCYRLRWI